MIDFKTFRKINNYTQVEAANYFGCSQAFIHQLEKRARPTPLKFIEKLKSDPIQTGLLKPTMEGGILREKEITDVKDTEIITLQKDLIKTLKEKNELMEFKIESLEKELKKQKTKK